jgi:Adenylate and Guanylate cyclase catalytic domain
VSRKEAEIRFPNPSAVVFTSIVFLAYDAVIEKRQRKVMQSATRSSAIVSSLFPSKVRNRLYDESLPKANEKELSTQNRLKNFMAKTEQRSVEPINTGPIADLFESTTVLFADIKGFTKWYESFLHIFTHDVFSRCICCSNRSSTREPTAVFTLLETLYGAFDKLAEKWGVYKVSS